MGWRGRPVTSYLLNLPNQRMLCIFIQKCIRPGSVSWVAICQHHNNQWHSRARTHSHSLLWWWLTCTMATHNSDPGQVAYKAIPSIRSLSPPVLLHFLPSAALLEPKERDLMWRGDCVIVWLWCEGGGCVTGGHFDGEPVYWGGAHCDGGYLCTGCLRCIGVILMWWGALLYRATSWCIKRLWHDGDLRCEGGPLMWRRNFS